MFGRIRRRRLHDTLASITSAFSGACIGRCREAIDASAEPRLFDASSELQVVRARSVRHPR
jgi:ADP-ribosylglycohydrolase